MFYYIDTIEQVKGTEENPINEYGKREIIKAEDGSPATLEVVESKFYKKLSDVSADLVTIDESKKHYYMDIRIVNSTGGVVKKDKVGQYVESNA